MKLLAIMLSLLLLTGCASTVAKLEIAEETVESKLEMAEENVEMQIESVTSVPAPTATVLTEEEVIAIVLEHAGVSAEQAEHLRAQYELDDGVPEYEVDFRVGMTEYEYTVHAETGAILSFEMGD